MPGIVHVLVVGAAVFACGAFLTARRPAQAVAGLALMLAGSGIDLAGMGRFASSGPSAAAAQELAVLAAGVALGVAGLGVALARLDQPR